MPASAADVLDGRARWGVDQGHVLDRLRALPPNSVHCCVTSPPYWALRSYLRADDPLKPLELGSEPTPEEYVGRMVEVFAEVRRVLHPSGTLWLNVGDSYAATGKSGGGKDGERWKECGANYTGPKGGKWRPAPAGYKPKDLVGVPWMLAFALRAEGYYLRQEIIWHKPAPMPSSVRDRCTTAHEQLFLFSKSPRYFFDQEAISEPASGTEARPQQRRARELARKAGLTGEHIDALRAAGITDTGKAVVTQNGTGRNAEDVQLLAAEARQALGGYAREFLMAATRNKRSVWKVSSRGFKGAHFATFPPKLVEPCVLAGTSAEGVCPQCGEPWRRVVAKERRPTRPGTNSKVNRASDDEGSPYHQHSGAVVGNRDPQRHCTVTRSVGWQPGCRCAAGHPVPAVVLDPFAGSGTTLAVAVHLGRRAIGIELNADYLPLIEERMATPVVPPKSRRPKPAKDQPTFWDLYGADE